MTDEIKIGAKNFTDRLPFVVTAEDVNMRWAMQKPGSGTSFAALGVVISFKQEILRAGFTLTPLLNTNSSGVIHLFVTTVTAQTPSIA